MTSTRKVGKIAATIDTLNCITAFSHYLVYVKSTLEWYVGSGALLALVNMGQGLATVSTRAMTGTPQHKHRAESTVLSQRELKPSVKQSISFTRGLLGFVYFTDAPKHHISAQGPVHLYPSLTDRSALKTYFIGCVHLLIA